MKRELVIGNKYFTVNDNIKDCPKCTGRTLQDCYKKPSVKKQKIYNDWKKWAEENDVMSFGVSGYNSYVFSLNGIIVYEMIKYYIYITPTRNTLTRVF